MRYLNDWRIRLSICLMCALTASYSNYSAVKFQIGMSRFDMVGSSFSDVYAFAITMFSDLFIIYFHLVKIHWLVVVSTVLSLMLSIYAGTMLIFQTAGGSKFSTFMAGFSDMNVFFQFTINILIAVIPIVILNVMMLSVSEDLDV